MGKGDKRTFRGKLFKGSHGKTRPHHPKKTAAPRPVVARPAVAKPAVAKPAPVKPAAKPAAAKSTARKR